MYSSVTARILATAAVLISTTANASVFSSGNTYSIGISDTRSGYSTFADLAFDGRSQYRHRTDASGQPYLSVVIAEQEEDLGDRKHRISLSLFNPHSTGSGNADLFPIDPAEGDSPDLGIGLHFGADPFDFAQPLSLDFLYLRMYARGTLLTERELVSEYGSLFSSLTPWDGGLFRSFSGLGFQNGRGLGIDRIEFEFNTTSMVTAVPEPTSFALMGAGLFIVGMRQRRRMSTVSV